MVRGLCLLTCYDESSTGERVYESRDHGFDGYAFTKDGAKYFFNGLYEAIAKHYEASSW